MTDKLSPELLDELEQLLEKATPGPWAIGWNDNETRAVLAPGRQPVAYPVTPDINPYDAALTERTANEKLIVYARDALPALIKAAREWK